MEATAATAGGQPAVSERSARRVITLALVLVGALVSATILIAGVLPSLAASGPVDTSQVDRVAIAVAKTVDTSLLAAKSAAHDLSADPALRPLLGKTGPAIGSIPVPAPIVDVAATLAVGEPEITILTMTGVPRYGFLAGAATLPVDPPSGIPLAAIIGKAPGGLFVTGVTPATGSVHRISVATLIPAQGAFKGGIVVVSMSLDALMRSAITDDGTKGATLELIDESGAQVTSVVGPALPGGSSVDAKGTSIVATATKAVGLPAGFPAWTAIARVPIPAGATAPFPLPMLLLAVLVLVAACLMGIVISLRHTRRVNVSRRELAERYEQVATQAFVDVITGLGNQRAFHEECERQLALVRRGHIGIALVMLDLDDFKRVNDSDGHAAGDELLARFARHVEGCIRRSDRAFRVGGDEFAIIMPATDADGAEVVARRLLAMSLEPAAGKHSVMRTISFSAGISESPRFGTTREELFAQADAALYWSKRHGRTQVTIFDPVRMAVAGRVSDELSASVSTIVEKRQLRAVFQPVVDLTTGRILGYEGLIRPTTDVFSNPGALFVAAESTGRTVDLDYACLETVAAAAGSIPTDCYVALNLSPRTIEAPEFNALALCRRLARVGLPAQRIVLELTERETIEDVDRLRQGLEACRALGVRIAADDVGSGNAGLRLLSLVTFDVVKIDLSLVQDALTHEPSAEILAALHDMAARRGAVVIAEGVETSAQLRLVRSVGIDAAQGYLLGRPGEALIESSIDVEALLASDRSARIVAAA